MRIAAQEICREKNAKTQSRRDAKIVLVEWGQATSGGNLGAPLSAMNAGLFAPLRPCAFALAFWKLVSNVHVRELATHDRIADPRA